MRCWTLLANATAWELYDHLEAAEEHLDECESEFGSECAFAGDGPPGSAVRIEEQLERVNKLRKALGKAPRPNRLGTLYAAGHRHHDTSPW